MAFLKVVLEKLRNQIKLAKVPEHIAVIMDGNGRWAQRQGIKRIFGHQNAIEAVKNIIEGAIELNVKYLTLYAFSTENWGRPKFEVDGLIALLVSTIQDELFTLQENKIKLSVIGEISELPAHVQKKLKKTIDITSENTRIQLVLALNYSGRWDLVNAVNKIINQGKIKVQVTDIDQNLSTKSIPDPDLLIRTSGEMRISNFLLWQLAYTELHFTDVLWPDFRKKDFYEAIRSYQKRERRFGRTSEQMKV